MATEGINPTVGVTEEVVVKYATRAFDDSISSMCILAYITLPNSATVRFDSFGDGVTPVPNRRSVHVAIIGGWNVLGRADPTTYLECAVQIKRVVDDEWITLLVESMAQYNNWSSTQWRRFDVTGIVGNDALSNYHVRVIFWASNEDPIPDVPLY
jgi:hypothetical protein